MAFRQRPVSPVGYTWQDVVLRSRSNATLAAAVTMVESGQLDVMGALLACTLVLTEHNEDLQQRCAALLSQQSPPPIVLSSVCAKCGGKT